MTLRLRREDYDAMVAHARAWLPNEACGLIAGKTDSRSEGEIRAIEKVFLLTNTDRSPEHFSIDPREHLAAVKEMRAQGLAPLGNFHSHPSSPARPSREDIRLAFDQAASYLILSLEGGEPVLKAFHIEGGAPSQEEIELV